jgi:hypothetical protein
MNLTHIDMEEIAPIWNPVLMGRAYTTFRGARVIGCQAPAGRSIKSRKMEFIINLIFDTRRQRWHQASTALQFFKPHVFPLRLDSRFDDMRYRAQRIVRGLPLAPEYDGVLMPNRRGHLMVISAIGAMVCANEAPGARSPI